MPPAARYFTEKLCKTPVRNRTKRFVVLNLLLGSITCGIVFVRTVFKRFYSQNSRLAIDDWLIVAAIILGVPSIAIMIFGLSFHGMGKDVWGVSASDIVVYARYLFVMEILYLTLMTLTKLSLCLFYLSIFAVGRVASLLWGTVVFHILFGVAFVFKCIFQCFPIFYYWEQLNFLHPSQGHCINLHDSAWAHAAINVASDIWLLALPLSQLRQLRLHWKKKLAAAIMVITGAMQV